MIDLDSFASLCWRIEIFVREKFVREKRREETNNTQAFREALERLGRAINRK